MNYRVRLYDDEVTIAERSGIHTTKADIYAWHESKEEAIDAYLGAIEKDRADLFRKLDELDLGRVR